MFQYEAKQKGAIAPLANTKLAFSVRSLREQCQTVCRLCLHMLFAPLLLQSKLQRSYYIKRL